MERQTKWGILLCVAAGAARAVDLALWTDPVTGFSAGSTALRYGGYALVLAVLFVLGRSLPDSPAPAPDSVLLSRLCGLTAAFAALYGLSALAEAAVSARVLAVLALLAGVWYAAMARLLRAEGNAAMARHSAWAGVAGNLFFPALAVTRYFVNPSSLARVGVTAQMLNAVFLMLFAGVFLRVLFLPGRCGRRRGFFWGMSAFFAGVCLEVPQAAFDFAGDFSAVRSLLAAAALGGLGLMGLAVAAWAADPRCSPLPQD